MLRLDFETFTLVGTNGSANDNEGDCLDTFMVTVSCAAKIRYICVLVDCFIFQRFQLVKSYQQSVEKTLDSTVADN